MSDDLFKSALSEREGVAQPPSVNPYWKKNQRKKKEKLPIEQMAERILLGDRTVLSQAITLVESISVEHTAMAQELIDKLLPYSGNSVRIGITGVPGVGKSTFIESFGKYVTGLGHKLAVLAIDPSSERSKGSILGDKTRMEELSTDPDAFIRPSPSGLTLGGVARKTREVITLCEAAGFDVIIVETVGVGQSETVVKSMVDFFLLLMLSGAGDELQGIKRGIMEMADAIVINKADGDNVDKANFAKSQYQAALRLFPPCESGWEVPVKTCSAIKKINIDAVWGMIEEYRNFTTGNGYFDHHRKQQSVKIFYDWMETTLVTIFFDNQKIKEEIDRLIPEIQNGTLSPYIAGNIILDQMKENGRK
ncbi:methylmalonyl Co-A mutase-associated GTPase MeaB [Bacteroidales bacterium OttesenSCG-928-B11]|nr:methylmalonyl Co-A mutase-associated GTPase MeaB [Bacteroidales bacterium OttesenSCG-928-E04]MDL2309465.1 methylmalonyl Co-A mutase-associated GTPase MeaB [Bacteroidales bacterium OttesenSCG-928-C03]MDL2312072.1 methylmalonyl Co-A mutase-associated GTPase MeaB [Bacteroidales bacterium OttesenSCG-928-B11]MDL2325682.1 methylmalonyl Co-A mutase-associated GTPase MeaB [Bacteroidales bacterium OttesenSCG-928-A14]